jgi:hypothetical protein
VANAQWTLEVFQTDDGAEPFTRFIDKELSDDEFAALDAALKQVLAVMGLELAKTEWLKALGDGLYEFRLRHTADEIRHMFGGSASKVQERHVDILLRVFVHFFGQRVILLLSGYDKGDDSSERRQQREITEARKYLKQWKLQERRSKAASKKLPGHGGRR